MKETVKRNFESGVVVVIKTHKDFETLQLTNPEAIVVCILDWSEDETKLLAKKYCNGADVYINRTQVKSPRFPRPYKANATAEELLIIKKQTTVANNKTCACFIKEVYKIITKGFKQDPRQYVDFIYETTIKLADKPWVPKTYAIQQAIDGIEEALAELKEAVSEEETIKVERDIAMYASGFDCNKHIVTHSIKPVKQQQQKFPITKEYTDENGIKHSKRYWCQEQNYKKADYFVKTTDEVYTWEDSFRGSLYDGSRNSSNKIYVSDVQDVLHSAEKIKEAKIIADWLAEHDMFDIYALHCPNCGKVMNVYNGCHYCGFDLPKQAICEYTHGRISATELSEMQPEEIYKIFEDEDTMSSYNAWQDYTEDEN